MGVERGPMYGLNSGRQRQIKTLQRRTEFLEGRIGDQAEAGRDRDYDRAELGALRWLLEIVEAAEAEGILSELDMRRRVENGRTRDEEAEVEALVRRGIVAVQRLRDEREEERREKSLATFGHPGASIPGTTPSMPEEVRAVIEAVL